MFSLSVPYSPPLAETTVIWLCGRCSYAQAWVDSAITLLITRGKVVLIGQGKQACETETTDFEMDMMQACRHVDG